MNQERSVPRLRKAHALLLKRMPIAFIIVFMSIMFVACAVQPNVTIVQALKGEEPPPPEVQPPVILPSVASLPSVDDALLTPDEEASARAELAAKRAFPAASR